MRIDLGWVLISECDFKPWTPLRGHGQMRVYKTEERAVEAVQDDPFADTFHPAKLYAEVDA